MTQVSAAEGWSDGWEERWSDSGVCLLLCMHCRCSYATAVKG